MQLLNISVPKPCHENWESMSQEEKGRFCSVCSKTVLDFTTQSKEEVLTYVANHAYEKMCGRFRNDQLQQAPAKIEIPLSVVYRKVSSMQAFALALLIVFGSGLFSCTNPGSEVLGKMALKNDMPKGILEFKRDSSITMGDTVAVEHYLKGEVMGDYIIQPEKKTLKHISSENCAEEFPVDTVNIPQVDIVDSKMPLICFTTGLMAIEIKPDQNTIDTLNIHTKIDSPTENTPLSGGEGQGVRPYPNPTSGHITVNLNLKTMQKVQIDLYSSDGKYIRTLIPLQNLDASDYSMELNISDQPPAFYLLRSIVDGKTKTDRVELVK